VLAAVDKLDVNRKRQQRCDLWLAVLYQLVIIIIYVG